jgi:hypothetical protein
MTIGLSIVCGAKCIVGGLYVLFNSEGHRQDRFSTGMIEFILHFETEWWNFHCKWPIYLV